MISFLTPLATDGISYAYGYVFVGMNVVGALVVWFFLYESVSLSLENVDLMYSDPSVKAWKSRSWVPPGYINRKDKDESEKARSTAAGAAGHRDSDSDAHLAAGTESGSENGVLDANKRTRSSEVPGVEHRA